MPIPTNLQTAVPYLILKDCKSFIVFMQNLFSAETTELHYRDEEKNIVMHAELKIGNAFIMCAEATEEFKTQTSGIFMYVDDADISYNKALELGCISIMPLSNQHYGRTCGVQDTFGNTWWITAI